MKRINNPADAVFCSGESRKKQQGLTGDKHGVIIFRSPSARKILLDSPDDPFIFLDTISLLTPYPLPVGLGDMNRIEGGPGKPGERSKQYQDRSGNRLSFFTQIAKGGEALRTGYPGKVSTGC